LPKVIIEMAAMPWRGAAARPQICPNFSEMTFGNQHIRRETGFSRQRAE
jgi:hypothetical protein